MQPLSEFALPPVSGELNLDDLASASAAELLELGLQNARLGQLHPAAEALAQSILMDSKSAEAHDALATVMLALDNIEFACKAKAKAVGLGKNSSADWDMLGDMFVALGQADDAAQAFGTALALAPDSPDIKHKLRITTEAAKVLNSGVVEQPSADQLPLAWRVVNLVTIVPENNPHTAAFDDLISGFESALTALGITVRKRRNEASLEGMNLLFGGHLIATQEHAARIPHNTVIVNLEQLRGFNIGARPIYTGLLRRLAVWDYSARNIQQIERLIRNPHVSRFQIGYVPSMTRKLLAPQTTDVLFYGSLNGRRSSILTELTRAGLNVRHIFSVYGAERDRAIAEAKVVLNLHFYEDSIHEIVRTSYLLANGKAVVSECGPDTEIDEDIRSAMAAVPYTDVVSACVALVKDDAARHSLEQRAFEVFSRRDQSAILRDAIGATRLPVFE
ncbi:hypothetical protein DLM45_05160 [Hyphomicrobium methylovorum]|uniref:tetratricopeptide repeat protein n=1 Tax=Hyphomicrobium methylovorum TaxID=84 RepID=UPI0015E6A1E9|nr:tetratricopeptide repeat protein [Hyphomicrobium methylovorum]MBA2125613.1 hypothetical protein [Hyphomicrobium methylovorum]